MGGWIPIEITGTCCKNTEFKRFLWFIKRYSVVTLDPPFVGRAIRIVVVSHESRSCATNRVRGLRIVVVSYKSWYIWQIIILNQESCNGSSESMNWVCLEHIASNYKTIQTLILLLAFWDMLCNFFLWTCSVALKRCISNKLPCVHWVSTPFWCDTKGIVSQIGLLLCSIVHNEIYNAYLNNHEHICDSSIHERTDYKFENCTKRLFLALTILVSLHQACKIMQTIPKVRFSQCIDFVEPVEWENGWMSLFVTLRFPTYFLRQATPFIIDAREVQCLLASGTIAL